MQQEKRAPGRALSLFNQVRSVDFLLQLSEITVPVTSFLTPINH